MSKILIIDDDRMDRLLIKKAMLRVQPDLEILELDSGREAVSTIQSESPLATLLDIRMPGIDGFQVLKAIREDTETRSHPVIMVSGSDETSDKDMATEFGADGYLVKPDSFLGYGELAQVIFKTVFKGRQPE